ncbi:MAG TPA: TonB family protein [Acidiferrobacter sp.]|nr:TonB family protein [Acidiferrobacter sp.]
MSELHLKPADRLGIALFLAALLHLIVILGVRFDLPPAAMGRALDITLVQTESTTKPHHAVRLAQVNVQGGGGTHKHHMAHTPFAVTRNGGTDQYRKAHPDKKPSRHDQFRLLHTTAPSLHVTLSKPTWQLHAAIAYEMGITKQFAAEEARLKAEIRRDWRAYQITGPGRGGVTAQRFAYASYITRWNRHMERVGSRQYDQMLAGRPLTGSLVLAVKIRQNGTLEGIQVIRKSAYPTLDAAAMAMVRSAAPFAPLPKIAGARLSVLPIIETWHFRGGRITAARASANPTP